MIGITQLFSWRNFFLALDRGLKIYERLPWKPLRQRALSRRRSEWMLEHLERSEGLAAIYPAMMNAIFALVALGHSPDDPLTAREIDEFWRNLKSKKATRFACSRAFLRCGTPRSRWWRSRKPALPPDHPALVKAATWLLDNQI